MVPVSARLNLLPEGGRRRCSAAAVRGRGRGERRRGGRSGSGGGGGRGGDVGVGDVVEGAVGRDEVDARVLARPGGGRRLVGQLVGDDPRLLQVVGQSYVIRASW